MVYNIKKKIDIVESFPNFEHCPNGTHHHLAHFIIKLETDFLESAILEKINDTLSENIVYLNERWSLESTSQILKKELISSGFEVKQINMFVEDLPHLEVEIYG